MRGFVSSKKSAARRAVVAFAICTVPVVMLMSKIAR